MKQIAFGAFLLILLFAERGISQEIKNEKKQEGFQTDAMQNATRLKELEKAWKAEKDSLMREVMQQTFQFPAYTGTDLGLTFSRKKSVFKIWSPPAKNVLLRFYKEGTGGEPISTQKMKKGKKGVWTHQENGDKEGLFYTFQVELADGALLETPGPDAKAVGVNGQRAMVVDLASTNPPGWAADKRPPLRSFSDIVLYELHIRDVSVHESSGIKNKGKFLGLAETGTLSPAGKTTGIDHIKELGATHVHLLPTYDFSSLDERFPQLNKFNWGYDPKNYNVPEGSYATDPFDGRTRIREFKQMVKTMHENGLRVILDVVYNHTAASDYSVFNQTVPYYYYRWRKFDWSDASGCGNETASEREMMRQYIVESMKYWVTEYHVDGFRVDLMGIHDIETMNRAAKELQAIDPTIFIYGEGWTAGDSPLPESERAVKSNAKKLKGIAVFSDEFRDGVKGHVFKPNAKGFASGEIKLEESVKFGIVGAIEHPHVNYAEVNYSKAPWANEPVQCINYVSCHDNHTLWDRLLLSCQNDTEETRLQINKLAQTIVFTSQGVPFLHAGEEFGRTKQLVENSFESPDHINQINWDQKYEYADLFDYYKTLIQMRKEHPAFRMGNAAAVRNNLRFLDLKQENMIGYMLDGAAAGDKWKRILVIFNGQKVGKNVEIPAGDWKIVCHNYRISLNGMGKNTSGSANVFPFSAYILVEE